MNESVVVITGGGRGIGRAVAVRFGAAGAHVVAASRTARELEETRRAVEEVGGRCHVETVDLCAPEEIDGLVENTVSRFGRIDVWVNNAGVAPLDKIEELDPSQFEAIYTVNIRAVYHACRAVWPIMRKQGGVIVNTSSISAIDPFPGFAAYGASKAWVNAWTKALAEEGRPFDIRVNAVAPGAVETRMLRGAFPNFPKHETLDPSAIANVVFTLAQPDCRFITGQTIVVRK